MRRGKGTRIFLRRAQGSVSVYMITAVAAFMLLGALLIDFSRIAAFRHTSMLAVQSGVRSVISSYDADFYARYGLFIRGGEDGNELLRTTLEGFFADREENGVFPYLNAEWSEAGITESRPLADHDVFHRQVMEEMKYKAPIDVTLELAGRFRGVSSAVREAAATVDLLERMRKAYDRREAELDKVLEAQRQSGRQAVSALKDLIPYSSSSPAGEAETLEDAARRYAGYVSMRQALAHMGPKTDPRIIMHYVEAISSYESGVARLSSSLSSAGSRIETEAAALRGRAADALQQAQAANEEMKRIAGEAEASRQGSSGASGEGSGTEETVDSRQLDQLAEIRRSAKELIREDSFFDAFLTEVRQQADRASELSREAARASSVLSAVPGSVNLEAELYANAARMKEKLGEFAASYGEDGRVIRERSLAIQAKRNRDGERKALEKEAESEWTGWRELSGGLSGGREDPDVREAFQAVDRLFRDNLEWNRQQDDSSPSRFDNLAPSEGRDLAMESADSWLNALQEALVGTRDSLYFSEYVFARFSHSSPSMVKQMLEGKTGALPLESQEAEYVLYGWANPKGNIAAAYGEIFTLRLAVRTMEGLIESRGMGHPLVVLASALVYGVRNAVQDMRLLLERDAIPLSKYVDVETTYADYLRLFFLLHGGSPSRLSRLIAVIGHETGLALSEAYTYASAEGTASLRLWFFPGLMKVMGQSGQLGGTVKGNRYEAVYAADSSYQ